MAHKKGGGSNANNRDSRSKRLGVKRYDGQIVTVSAARISSPAQTLAAAKTIPSMLRWMVM